MGNNNFPMPSDETCVICLEQVPRDALFHPECGKASTTAPPIKHSICTSCARDFCRHALHNNGAARTILPNCPCPGCTATWQMKDIESVGFTDEVALFRERMSKEASEDQTFDSTALEDMIALRLVQRCPACNVPTIRNGGCPNMTCTRCHASWRWNTSPPPPWWIMQLPHVWRLPVHYGLQLGKLAVGIGFGYLILMGMYLMASSMASSAFALCGWLWSYLRWPLSIVYVFWVLSNQRPFRPAAWCVGFAILLIDRGWMPVLLRYAVGIGLWGIRMAFGIVYGAITACINATLWMLPFIISNALQIVAVFGPFAMVVYLMWRSRSNQSTSNEFKQREETRRRNWRIRQNHEAVEQDFKKRKAQRSDRCQKHPAKIKGHKGHKMKGH